MTIKITADCHTQLFYLQCFIAVIAAMVDIIIEIIPNTLESVGPHKNMKERHLSPLQLLVSTRYQSKLPYFCMYFITTIVIIKTINIDIDKTPIDCNASS